MIKSIRDYQCYQYCCSKCSIQHRKKQWLWQHGIFPYVWAKNKSVDYSHSTFGISFCCYLIHWQWSKRDEMQWRSKVRFKGIVLTCCISSLDTMLPSQHHSTHTRTHTEGKEKEKKICLIKLPQHASHHSYSINTTAVYNKRHAAPLDWMWAHQLSY